MNAADPTTSGPLPLERLSAFGRALQRPECVVATRSGRVYASNWRGGVSCIEGDGSVSELLAADETIRLRPNGIALEADGSFLLCHLGEREGGVYRLFAGGRVQPELLEAEGQPLPPTNFAHRDTQGRLWVSVSTRHTPRARAYRADISDGFIVLKDSRGVRIVADGIGYTNECLVHPDGKRLFVNETFARRLSSYDIRDDGSLTNKQSVTEFGSGTFPDGMAFDAEGGTWITSIVSNRLIRVDPSGAQTLVLEDVEPEHLERVERAFLNGELGRPHLDSIRSRKLCSISSLAFGGPDLKTIYLGCLLGEQLHTFISPVAGLAPVHWKFSGAV